MSDWLQLAGKSIAVFGVANRKSVAWHIGQMLVELGARPIFVVRTPERKAAVEKLVEKLAGDLPVLVCDVADDQQIAAVARQIAERGQPLAGLVHSIAAAEYDDGLKPFHQTPRRAMLRAFDVSCFSLIALADALKDSLAPDASVVTISISTTRMASENYGYMAPIKAALDSSLAFLAKSFSQFSQVRFNAVAPSLLKTSASAGIPGYVDAYLYAEQVIPRKKALRTEEAAAAAVWLLSPRSSGVNAQSLVVDAGMSINYFDREIIRRAMEGG